MSDEKGIYINVSTYLKGPLYEEFMREVDRQVREWLQSEDGRLTIKRAAVKSIQEHTARCFDYWGKDPRSEEFKKLVTDAVYRELFQQVGKELPAAPEPTGEPR